MASEESVYEVCTSILSCQWLTRWLCWLSVRTLLYARFWCAWVSFRDGILFNPTTIFRSHARRARHDCSLLLSVPSDRHCCFDVFEMGLHKNVLVASTFAWRKVFDWQPVGQLLSRGNSESSYELNRSVNPPLSIWYTSGIRFFIYFLFNLQFHRKAGIPPSF